MQKFKLSRGSQNRSANHAGNYFILPELLLAALDQFVPVSSLVEPSRCRHGPDRLLGNSCIGRNIRLENSEPRLSFVVVSTTTVAMVWTSTHPDAPHHLLAMSA